jgi:predicted RND superfamily exporter protein
MFHKIIHFPIHYKKTTLLFLILTTLLLGSGIKKLKFDFTTEKLFDKNSQAYIENKRIESTFFNTDEKYLINIYSEDPNLFSQKKLTILKDLHNDLSKLKNVISIKNIFTQENLKNQNGELSSTPPFETIPQTQSEFSRRSSRYQSSAFRCPC